MNPTAFGGASPTWCEVEVAKSPVIGAGWAAGYGNRYSDPYVLQCHYLFPGQDLGGAKRGNDRGFFPMSA